MSLGIKEIVSKNKLRYKEDGFDLDLSYIARNIIAMGFPAETFKERFYRNSINDVVKFFETRHKNHYTIYNLCSETSRRYDTSKFYGRVSEEYSFQDHNPPPFHKLKPFCESVHSWLNSNKNNVVAIHCKAGKGRTGVMICAYLVHAGFCEDEDGRFVKITDAESALEYYGRQRTRDLKGVTIPSQKRYVYYYEYLVKHNLEYRPVRLKLKTLILTSLPVYINGGAFTLICEIHHIPKPKIQSFDIEVKKGSKHLVFNLPEDLFLMGDVKFNLYIKKMKKEKILQFCFNTFFVQYGTDTYTVATEPCSGCVGERVSDVLYAARKPDLNKINQCQPVIDLTFLKLIKHENLFYPCDCSNSIPSSLSCFNSSDSSDVNFDPNNHHHHDNNQQQRQEQPNAEIQSGTATLNPLFASPYNNMMCDGKISTSTSSSPTSSKSSSTHSLCNKKNISASDLKSQFNSERNLYLVLPKEKLDKAYKDKANKMFAENFKVILRFNQMAEDDTDCMMDDKNMECFTALENCNNNNNNNNSESDNPSSEDDEEVSDQEFNIPGGGNGLPEPITAQTPAGNHSNDHQISDESAKSLSTTTAPDKKGEITYL